MCSSASAARGVLAIAAICAGLTITTRSATPVFFPDDPLQVDNDRTLDAGKAARIEGSNAYDFAEHTFLNPGDPEPRHAVNVNTLDGFDVSGDPNKVLAQAEYRFARSDFQEGNRAQLEAAMHAALVEDGLFADEATALLTTWQRSYFASPGLRIFYLVPRVWTEHYLPLTLSEPATIKRVMIGRLELISDEQRALLGRLAKAAPSDGTWLEKAKESPALDRFLAGRSDFGDLGVKIPPDYQMYLALGRFRNALVAHEESVRPTETLTRFIDTYELHPFRVPK